MRTLTVSEAAGNLAEWLRLMIAGEDIAIRADDGVVALHPLPAGGTLQKPAPREALRRLQQDARLTPQEADRDLKEIRAERLAADKSAA